jgi:hypothetical protein
MPHSTEVAGRIRTLAVEYVELVDQMRGGQYDDEDAYRYLSSQRTLVHDDLIALTGVTERKEMYGYCRELLRGRQGSGALDDFSQYE